MPLNSMVITKTEVIPFSFLVKFFTTMGLVAPSSKPSRSDGCVDTLKIFSFVFCIPIGILWYKNPLFQFNYAIFDVLMGFL